MLLLDTDTITHLHAGHPRVIARLQASDDPIVGTTIITRVEVFRGRIEFLLKAATGDELLRAQSLLARTEELFEQMIVIGFDEAAVSEFDRLRRLKGLGKLGRADLLIASITLANQATLVTRNIRHFQPVSGLKIVNWVD